MQRVRIGLTGLASVFLLVLLAAAFLGLVNDEGKIRTDATGNVVIEKPGDLLHGDSGEPKEPLAELGVTPGNAPDQGANSSGAR